MNITQNQELKDRIIDLARRKATGTPGMLAEKLNVSERNLYRILDVLKDEQGLKYCKRRKTYFLD